MTARAPARAEVRFVGGSDPLARWRVYLPAVGPECFDVDGESYLGPWGDTYWPSWEAACGFLADLAAEATT